VRAIRRPDAAGFLRTCGHGRSVPHLHAHVVTEAPVSS
jgi:hypothetical protein